MRYDFEGQTVYPSADLEALTGATAGYIGTLNADAAPVHAFTIRSIVASFEWEAFRYQSGVWKPLTWQDREAVHPALRSHFGDPYRVQDAPISALASEGFAPDAPLSDADVTGLLGPSLARVADAAFKRAVFYTDADVTAIREAYAVTLAGLEVEAKRNAAARESRKTRGPSRAEQANPFTVNA